MSQYIAPLGIDLVIPNGQQYSNIITATGSFTAGASDGFGYRDAESIDISAPQALPEQVFIQVDTGPVGTPDNFDNLQVAGADQVVSAGKAVTIQAPAFRQIRLSAPGNVGGTRTFKVNKRCRV